MANDIDPNAVAATVITTLIHDMLRQIRSAAGSFVSRHWSLLSADFSNYLQETYNKTRYVRILSQKSEDVDLYSVYVPSKFKSDRRRIRENSLISSIRDGKHSVIVGNGGAGKTFFMRHLWQSIFNSPEGRVPLFIELRKYNERSTLSFLDLIRTTVCQSDKIDSDAFEQFLVEGRFIILMDGFDELIFEKRDALQRDLFDFVARYPSSTFVVSSRADSRFAGWQSFTVYESLPFDLGQVRRLICCVPFYEDTKSKFLSLIDKKFFGEHSEFLSSPLLAIMMLMTYRDNADIPRKMSIFYDQAFNTLFQWHDATKTYIRPKSLDIDQFRRSFGFFCLLSYLREYYEFSRSDIISFIKEENSLAGIDCDSEDTLRDFQEGVNMVKEDGLNYMFIHRSFQEYFSALTIVSFVPEKAGDIVNSVARRASDNVIRLCYEMAPDLLVREFVLANLGAVKALLPSAETRWGFLESAGVIFTLHLAGRKDADGKFSLGLSVSLNDSDMSYVINTLGSLFTGTVPDHLAPSYIHDSFLDFRLFDVIDGFIGDLESGVLSVSFDQGKILVANGETKRDRVFSDQTLSEIADHLETKSALFLDMASQFKATMLVMIAHWESVATEIAKRGRSLDLLLTPGSATSA